MKARNLIRLGNFLLQKSLTNVEKMIKKANSFFFSSNLSDKFYLEENPEPCSEYSSEKQSK